MSYAYYSQLKKEDILKSPTSYAWNCVLRYIQFTQAELIAMKAYVELPELIRFQTSVTKAFLTAHFQAELDACLEVDSCDIAQYVHK